MKNKKVARTLILSGLGILLASSIAVGATYSLWNDSVSVNTHLASGNLKVKLERTSLTKCTLDSDTGRLVTSTSDETIDLGSSTENVFGISDGEKVVPGSYYEAAMKLTNNGSTAFDYTVNVDLKDDEASTLASQILVYVDGKKVDHLYSEAHKGKLQIATGSMDKGTSPVEFSVKVEFEDMEDNNSAMDQEASFDLSVVATQSVSSEN